MTDQFEHRFSLFLDDARQIGSPRSWQRAAVDIRDYLNKEDLVVEGFDNNTPGKVKQSMRLKHFSQCTVQYS